MPHLKLLTHLTVVALALTSLSTHAQSSATLDVFVSAPNERGALHGLETLQADGVVITVHDLSAQKRIEQQLSADLPAEKDAALDTATARIHSLTQTTRDALRAAHEAHAAATHWRIARTPAFVIDGEHVRYDATDAVSLWRRHQAAKKESGS